MVNIFLNNVHLNSVKSIVGNQFLVMYVVSYTPNLFSELKQTENSLIHLRFGYLNIYSKVTLASHFTFLQEKYDGYITKF